MKRWLVLFSGVGYEWTTERIFNGAASHGVDEIRCYDDVWLEKHPSRQLNKHLFETKDTRGRGWFFWKPMIILDTFKVAAPGDVVMYLDSDTYWASAPSAIPLYDLCERDGIVCFDCSGRMSHHWTRRDCFIAMDQDESKYHNSLAGCARFGLWKVGDYRAEQFLYEWLCYSINTLCNTREKVGEEDKPSRYGAELPEFQTERGSGYCEHRTEQAIYTLLAHKYGIPLQPEASAGGSAGVGLSYFEQSHDTSSINPGVHCKHFNVPMP